MELLPLRIQLVLMSVPSSHSSCPFFFSCLSFMRHTSLPMPTLIPPSYSRAPLPMGQLNQSICCFKLCLRRIGWWFSYITLQISELIETILNCNGYQHFHWFIPVIRAIVTCGIWWSRATIELKHLSCPLQWPCDDGRFPWGVPLVEREYGWWCENYELVGLWIPGEMEFQWYYVLIQMVF